MRVLYARWAIANMQHNVVSLEGHSAVNYTIGLSFSLDSLSKGGMVHLSGGKGVRPERQKGAGYRFHPRTKWSTHRYAFGAFPCGSSSCAHTNRQVNTALTWEQPRKGPLTRRLMGVGLSPGRGMWVLFGAHARRIISLSEGRGWLAPRAFTSGCESGEGLLPRLFRHRPDRIDNFSYKLLRVLQNHGVGNAQ